MKAISTTNFPEVLIIEPTVYTDIRGYFYEVYHSIKYSKHNIPEKFVQTNISYSKKGVLRGLHYQIKRPQGKLIWVVLGEIFDVAVDIRKGSPTFGKWTSALLSSKTKRQIYIPEGFAHGFCVISESAYVLYQCTELYDPLCERGIRWDDPYLSIEWPIDEPIVSEKDKNLQILQKIEEKDLPLY